ncbi:hypothetical protein ABBQ32_009664 [Trebouxia sp. C0010 RCD-2024]
MAWVFEKSPTWRRIVAKSRESPAFYAAFAAACFAVPYGVGKAVMWATNPEVARKRDMALQAELRGRQTYHHESLAKANRARLAVLLGEMQSGKSSEDRYEAALRGESLGTHSRGTTVGAQGIKHASHDQKQ